MAVVGAGAASAQCCGICLDAKTKALVGKALVLDLSEQLGLASDEVAVLLDEFGKYQEQVASLKSQRAEVKGKLTAAIESSAAGAEVSGLLDKLQGLDEQLFQLKNDALDAYVMDLTTEQLAQCYLFLADYDEIVCSAIRAMRGAGAPGSAPCPAAAAAAAPAEAAPAEATTAKPGDKAVAAAKAWGDALAAQDLEKIMACFADDFEHYEYGDKAGIRDFIGQAMDMGYLEDLEVSVDDAEAEVDGDEVIVYPVELMGAFGSITFELVFEERNGEMKITGMDASGL